MGKKGTQSLQKRMSLEQTYPGESHGISQLYVSRSEQKMTDFRTLQYIKPSDARKEGRLLRAQSRLANNYYEKGTHYFSLSS